MQLGNWISELSVAIQQNNEKAVELAKVVGKTIGNIKCCPCLYIHIFSPQEKNERYLLVGVTYLHVESADNRGNNLN